MRIVESSRPAVYRRSGELAAPAQTPTLAVRGQDLTDAAALRVVERSVRLISTSSAPASSAVLTSATGALREENTAGTVVYFWRRR